MADINKLIKLTFAQICFIIYILIAITSAQLQAQNKFLPEPLWGKQNLNKVIKDTRTKAFVYPGQNCVAVR